MNGSENFYAGAIFFVTVSLGAFLKLDGSTGWAVGVMCALVAAVLLRRGLMKAAQAVEEDHQRVEVQFQQLRNKIAETSAPTVTAMNSLNDAAQLVQENMQLLATRLNGLDNLTRLAESSEAIRSTVAVLDENSSALNAELEKFFVAMQEHESFDAATEELRKISAIEETNRANLRTVLELLQIVGHGLQSHAYDTDLSKLLASVDGLNEKLAELVKLNATLAKDNAPALDEEDLDLLKHIAAKITAK